MIKTSKMLLKIGIDLRKQLFKYMGIRLDEVKSQYVDEDGDMCSRTEVKLVEDNGEFIKQKNNDCNCDDED